MFGISNIDCRLLDAAAGEAVVSRPQPAANNAPKPVTSAVIADVRMRPDKLIPVKLLVIWALHNSAGGRGRRRNTPRASLAQPHSHRTRYGNPNSWAEPKLRSHP